MGRCRGYAVQGVLMQFLVLIVVEDQFFELNLERFAHGFLGQIHRLEQPLFPLLPTIAELLPVKTFFGFHAFCLSRGQTPGFSLAYYGNAASRLSGKETVR